MKEVSDEAAANAILAGLLNGIDDARTRLLREINRRYDAAYLTIVSCQHDRVTIEDAQRESKKFRDWVTNSVPQED